MQNVNVNLTELMSSVDKAKEKIEDYYMAAINAMNPITNDLSFTWNDNNTQPFIEQVMNDKDEVSNHLTNQTEILGEIKNFCEDLRKTIKCDLGLDEVNSIRMSASSIESSLSYLDNISSGLDKVSSIANSASFPSDFAYTNYVRSIISASDYENLNSEKIRIKKFVSNVDNVIAGGKKKLSPDKYKKLNDSVTSAKMNDLK